ncbi:MAG: helix-turn-helix transcriptional regulator [Oscillospiraceae bacterium]|nr:helix-turn-helix transcriptional regulator [Oscillospiraceae bacterium]
METGMKIKGYLDSKGISQAFLSSKCRIKPAALSLALNGKRKLTFTEYENICWALGLGVDAFLEPKPPTNTNVSN